jgi:hypothetical protein
VSPGANSIFCQITDYNKIQLFFPFILVQCRHLGHSKRALSSLVFEHLSLLGTCHRIMICVSLAGLGRRLVSRSVHNSVIHQVGLSSGLSPPPPFLPIFHPKPKHRLIEYYPMNLGIPMGMKNLPVVDNKSLWCCKLDRGINQKRHGEAIDSSACIWVAWVAVDVEGLARVGWLLGKRIDRLGLLLLPAHRLPAGRHHRLWRGLLGCAVFFGG